MTKIDPLFALKYPIGEFKIPVNIKHELISKWIKEIELFPERINTLTNTLSKEALNYNYRPMGWTIKQVVHHCADSHMNAIIRFKLTMTEELPTIKPYFEDRWANLDISHSDDISNSLVLISALHKQWVSLLKSLNSEQLARQFFHPESKTKSSLSETIGMYAWHGNHHLAHIKQGLQFKNVFTK